MWECLLVFTFRLSVERIVICKWGLNGWPHYFWCVLSYRMIWTEDQFRNHKSTLRWDVWGVWKVPHAISTWRQLELTASCSDDHHQPKEVCSNIETRTGCTPSNLCTLLFRFHCASVCVWRQNSHSINTITGLTTYRVKRQIDNRRSRSVTLLWSRLLDSSGAETECHHRIGPAWWVRLEVLLWPQTASSRCCCCWH